MNLYTNPILLFWMTVIGTVTGVAGLYYSILAWREAIKAREAAQSAANQIQGIKLLDKASRLQALCNNIDNYIDVKAYKDARYSIKEIRLGIVELKEDLHTKEYLDLRIWEEMIEDLRMIDYVLMEAVLTKAQNMLSIKERSECGRRIDSVGNHLTAIKSKCQHAAEVIK